MGSGISLRAQREKRNITEGNFAESLQSIENMLEPGTPVMIHNFSSHEISIFPSSHSEKVLFFSEGKLSRDGVFNLQKGKRNFSYVLIDDGDSSYRIVNHRNKELDNHRIEIPKSWHRQEYNEGTFSPAGPTTWTSFHSKGTEEIIVGNSLVKQFPNAMNALKFARDAFYFELDSFYSIHNPLVFEIGDKLGNDEIKEERLRQENRNVCLRASLNLLTEAELEINEYHDKLIATQVGRSSKEPKRLREEGYPVDKHDYLVRELSHPRRGVAFVKNFNTFMYGGAYILPFENKTDKVVELAFSEDMIKKHYPYGFKK